MEKKGARVGHIYVGSALGWQAIRRVIVFLVLYIFAGLHFQQLLHLLLILSHTQAMNLPIVYVGSIRRVPFIPLVCLCERLPTLDIE